MLRNAAPDGIECFDETSRASVVPLKTVQQYMRQLVCVCVYVCVCVCIYTYVYV